MTRRGWGGAPPRDDDEARDRIVEAAVESLRSTPASSFALSDVAEALGVTRPTVYRHFASTEELLEAVSAVVAERFGERQADHLAGISDPLDWAVEAVSYAIEHLPEEPLLLLLVEAGRPARFARDFTTPVALAANRPLFERSSVDWRSAGLGPAELDELAEIMLRILQSMIVAPRPARSGKELRRFLRRWIGGLVPSG